MAKVTQSAGVPLTANHRVRICRRRKGLCKVMARPTAFCIFSGATTHTSPKAARDFTRARMPGASMPSSFVTRIRLGCTKDMSCWEFENGTEKPAPISLGRACQLTQLADNLSYMLFINSATAAGSAAPIIAEDGTVLDFLPVRPHSTSSVIISTGMDIPP